MKWGKGVIPKGAAAKATLGLNARQLKKVLSTASERKNKTTRLGHALSKHSGRESSRGLFGKTSGGEAKWHDQAKKHLDEILQSPGGFQKAVGPGGKTFLEKYHPDGRGVRLQLDYKFHGFRGTPSTMIHLAELVFEGLTRELAKSLTRRVLGRAATLPTESEVIVQARMASLTLTAQTTLLDVGVNLVLCEGSVYNLEIIFDPEETTCSSAVLVRSLHAYAIQLATSFAVDAFCAGYEPVDDQDIRFFTGSERGPLFFSEE